MKAFDSTFEAWYADHYGSVLAGVSLFCIGDHARAEDAANDACIKAYERWSDVSRMHSPTAWTTRVAINNAKRSYRKTARTSEYLNTDLLESAYRDSTADIDLLRALSDLPSRQRSALILRYVEDLPQAAVADRMGVARGTASASLTQARRQLRTYLEEG